MITWLFVLFGFVSVSEYVILICVLSFSVCMCVFMNLWFKLFVLNFFDKCLYVSELECVGVCLLMCACVCGYVCIGEYVYICVFIGVFL